MTTKTSSADAVDFLVDRRDLHRCRFAPAAESDATPLAEGQALIRVDAFGFSANNITYAVFGEAMSYWKFFPAEEGWGRVPVWGFGDVVASRTSPGAGDPLAEGERVFGYFPMSTHLVVTPGAVTAAHFVDAAEHRAALPPVYNQYVRVAADPVYDARTEDRQMLLWPLFVTGFLLDDFVADNAFFGARAVVLSSASSKTALGMAFQLSKNHDCEVIGLTSSRNVPFVEGLGCYDRVVPYDRIESLPSDLPVVFVDMAGDGAVVSALHHHFGDRMKYSCVVGATHWDRAKREENLPGPEPAFFFAPAQVQKRTADWGPGGLQERMASAWKTFLDASEGWIRVERGRGTDAVERVYRDTLEGRVRPDVGHVLSL